MADLNDLANLLFPDVTKTIDDLEKENPPLPPLDDGADQDNDDDSDQPK